MIAASPAPDDAAVPRIDPVPPGVVRPSWSVMIPAYDAGGYLEQALRSVLDQDPGPDRMQIAVVDDASPGADRAGAIVRGLAPGRVEFHRAAENLGLAGNWNRCIGLARGRWVHLLHQDDWVLPGFYERLARADAEAPGAGAAFCRHASADEDGHWSGLSPLERRQAGIAEGLLERLGSTQRIQCPAIAVRRSTYEALGGFRGDLRYTLDWEMWCRIAARSPIWYEPQPLACYRRHPGSVTAALMRDSALLPDVRRVVPIIRRHVPGPLRPKVGLGQLAWLRAELLAEADRALGRGDRRVALARLREARACGPAARWDAALARRYARTLKLSIEQAVGLWPRPADGRPAPEALPR